MKHRAPIHSKSRHQASGQRGAAMLEGAILLALLSLSVIGAIDLFRTTLTQQLGIRVPTEIILAGGGTTRTGSEWTCPTGLNAQACEEAFAPMNPR